MVKPIVLLLLFKWIKKLHMNNHDTGLPGLRSFVKAE